MTSQRSADVEGGLGKQDDAGDEHRRAFLKQKDDHEADHDCRQREHGPQDQQSAQPLVLAAGVRGSFPDHDPLDAEAREVGDKLDYNKDRRPLSESGIAEGASRQAR